jgi:hypothetical protein
MRKLNLKGFEGLEAFANHFEFIAGKPEDGACFAEPFEGAIAK